MLAAKHDKRVPLFAYLDGTLELMSPSFDHEWITRQIEQMLVQYCVARDVLVSGLGSWTLKSKLESVGVEPDDCYLFGPSPRGRRRPDLAIEVLWTRGKLSKLEIYRRLHVPEVWIWKQGKITVYRLRRTGYAPAANSRFVPEIDLDQVCAFIGRYKTTTDLVRAYQAALARAQ